MANKLIIYETTHFEILPSLIKLASPLFDKVCVYANHPFVYDMVCTELSTYQNIQWVCRDEGKCSNRAFIKKMFLNLQKEGYTHLHISTLDHNLLYFSFKLFQHKNIHVSLTVHAINNYTQYRFCSLKQITESFAKFFLHKKINHYRVLMPFMVSYLEKKLSHKNVQFIPGNFFCRDNSFPEEKKAFRIVVPGSIEHKRRNYEQLVEICNLVFPESLNPIEIVLLGNNNNPYAKSIIQKIQALIGNRNNLFLTTFQSKVSEIDFINFFRSADIIFSPLQKEFKTNKGDAVEINGLSHSTGLFADLIRFPSPLIVPEGIYLADDLTEVSCFYDSSKKAADIILHFVNDYNHLQNIRQEMTNVCSNYHITAFSKSFKKLANIENYWQNVSP